MREAIQPANDTIPPPPNLRLVTEIIDDTPENTVVQERDRVSGLMTRQEHDIQTLREAFGNFELDARTLPDENRVTRIPLEGSDEACMIIIEQPDETETTCYVGLEDGVPYWELEGAKLEPEFEKRLVNLIEDCIADARRK